MTFATFASYSPNEFHSFFLAFFASHPEAAQPIKINSFIESRGLRMSVGNCFLGLLYYRRGIDKIPPLSLLRPQKDANRFNLNIRPTINGPTERREWYCAFR
ncbi:hypothetical protein TNIN_102791 [Trichonephila inaurata madagascariensis]|uniref:Uncharacterized protein n=1 Tax=Trichonephila inaurata madagascariensis TaxID=2747483 RepID=A0A8X6YTV2_9ARAC|nr:hypothetical protein TNIN_102791 [Trichonephila inaurata madagascariensis]